MTDRIKVNQVLSQVETDTTPQIKVTQALSQVETDSPPLIKVTQLLAQVEVLILDIAVVGSGGVQIDGTGPTFFTGPVVPPVTWTVVQIVGSGGVAVSGAGVIGTVGIIVTPPSWTTVQIIGSGGVQVSGAGVVSAIGIGVPPTIWTSAEVIGSGGVVVDGTGSPSFIELLVNAVIAHGGVEVGGQGVAGFVGVTAPTVTAFIASGGVQVGGSGAPQFVQPISPTIYAVVASGGVEVGYYRLQVAGFIDPATLVSAVIASGGVVISGDAVVALDQPEVFAVTTSGVQVQISGAGGFALISPAVFAVIGSGGVIVGTLAEAVEAYGTWVLTGNKFSASVYSGFDFNSYARYRGREYAAGADGIYLLGGSDDDGQPIHPGVRLVTNFGSEKHKRLRSIHLGRCGEETQVRVEADTGEGTFIPEDNGGRVVVSRDLESQLFTLDFVDFEQLSHLEIAVLPLNKR
jgi:hypothetical protein